MGLRGVGGSCCGGLGWEFSWESRILSLWAPECARDRGRCGLVALTIGMVSGTNRRSMWSGVW